MRAKPGFVEIDLVSQDGGNGSGEFAHTLDVVDIATPWTQTQALKNKAQRWVSEALRCMANFPLPIKGIDSDNGSKFINAHLLRFTTDNQITSTRGRAYNNNDSCYVEQKNWAAVRKTVV